MINMGWGKHLDPVTKKFLGIRCYRIGNYKVWAKSRKEALQIIKKTKKKDPFIQVDFFNPIVSKIGAEGFSLRYYPKCIHKKKIDFKNYTDELNYFKELGRSIRPNKPKKRKKLKGLI